MSAPEEDSVNQTQVTPLEHINWHPRCTTPREESGGMFRSPLLFYYTEQISNPYMLALVKLQSLLSATITCHRQKTLTPKAT